MFRPEWFSVQFIDILAVNKIVIRAPYEPPLCSSERYRTSPDIFVVSWRCSWHCQVMPRLWSNSLSRFSPCVCYSWSEQCVVKQCCDVRYSLLLSETLTGAVTRSHLQQLSFDLIILPWHYVICLTQPVSTDLSSFLPSSSSSSPLPLPSPFYYFITHPAQHSIKWTRFHHGLIVAYEL